MADMELAQRLRMAREAVGLTLGEAAARLGSPTTKHLAILKRESGRSRHVTGGSRQGLFLRP